MAFAELLNEEALELEALGVDVICFSGDKLLGGPQAGILLEVLKDLFYQCFVRRGKLNRALKVRRFFVEEGVSNLADSA